MGGRVMRLSAVVAAVAVAGGSSIAAAIAGATVSAGSPAGASACAPGATRTALGSFVAAFNGGSYLYLDGLFAGPPLFRWFSSNRPGLRVNAAAYRRDTLIGYFRARHLKRDRLRLVGFRFNGNSGGVGHFEFRMRRSAADFRRGAWFGLIGKGAAICEGSRVQFVVMSVGGPNSDRS